MKVFCLGTRNVVARGRRRVLKRATEMDVRGVLEQKQRAEWAEWASGGIKEASFYCNLTLGPCLR